jgi:WD40 repeat protein
VGSGDLVLWNLASRQRIGAPWPIGGTALSVAFSPNGETLASIDLDGQIQSWDVKSRSRLAGLTLRTGIDPTAMGMSDVIPGTTISASSLEGGLKATMTTNIVFSPDGSTLFLVAGDRTITVLDFEKHQQVDVLTAPLAVESLAVSPDGKLLASALTDGDILFWDAELRQQSGERLVGASAASVAFSPDGKTLASVAQDGNIVTLWDVASRRRLGFLADQIRNEATFGLALAFSPDGGRVASTSYDGSIIIWDVGVDSWLDRACGVVNRNLTCKEWGDHLGDEPYRKTCPTLPGPKSCEGQGGFPGWGWAAASRWIK